MVYTHHIMTSRADRLRVIRETAGAWGNPADACDPEKFVDELRSGKRLRELYEDEDILSEKNSWPGKKD